MLLESQFPHLCNGLPRPSYRVFQNSISLYEWSSFVYRLRDHLVCVDFWGPTLLSSAVALTFCTPTSSGKGVFPTLAIFWFFRSSQPNRCGVSSWFCFESPWQWVTHSIFHVLAGHTFVFFGEKPIYSPLSTFYPVGCAVSPHPILFTTDILSLWSHPLP